MQIPSTYRIDDSNYITKPVLQKFCLDNNLKTSANRIDLIKQIEEYADRSPDNLKLVYEWTEKILKMGMQSCLISKVFPISVETNVENELKHEFAMCPQKKICEGVGGKELSLASYNLFFDKDKLLERGEFTFLIKIVKAKSTYHNIGMTITYPIFVDVDFRYGFMVSRAKSSSGLFKVGEEQNVIDTQNKTSTEALMRYAEEIVLRAIKYTREDATVCKNGFKKAIFKILDSYTQTPKVIREKINKSKIICEEFAKNIFKEINVNVVGENWKDALYDLEIFIEKYSSITHPDRKIFMEDRNAYPVKFLAQDSEFTKIQEYTSKEDPLQSKKAFFDSKKVVYSNKKCDTITLCHERESKKYYSDKYFTVSISIDRSSCMVKFMSFVEEGDIQNVLSRVIQEFVV